MKDLQKVKEALEEIINQNQGTWDKPVSFGVLYTQAVDIARDALAELEKQGDDSLFGSVLMKDRRQELVDKVAGGTYKKSDEDLMCETIKGLDKEIPELESYELKLCKSYHVQECEKCKKEIGCNTCNFLNSGKGFHICGTCNEYFSKYQPRAEASK